MKFSEQWLREWVNPTVDIDDLAEQLTMAGLEVDAVEPVAGEFSDVVVAEILSAERHPDAEKLQVCRVSDGQIEQQIVCGAPNARAGLKVALAKVGAVLPGGLKIKKAKLRGVESFGMLCAEQELGMSDSSDGLLELAADAPVGSDLRQYLNLNDNVVELGLTPNRADCLSIHGVAREAALLNQMSFAETVTDSVAPACDDTLPVDIEAGEDCPRYVGRVVRGIDVSVPSPLWLQEKLRRCGLRSIDAVVDVTNLVMLELGQPMHAFDLAKLDGGIVVRKARADEELTLLDGQLVALRDDTLVIADRSKALAMAGIMGGEGSAVGADTVDIFLEAAFFAPELIAGRARSYGLHTDSSHRFERGVDYQLAGRAMERATALIVDICGGQPGPVVAVDSDHIPSRPTVELRESRIEKLLGIKILAHDVEAILTGLGMDAQRTDSGWSVTPPSWRFDIALEVDLLEELARIYGYNRLPVSPVHETLDIKPRPESRRSMAGLRQQLVSRGYQEVVSYSFIDPKLHQMVVDDEQAVDLLNPISADMSVMRTSLLAGLLKTAEYNSKRQQDRLRLFEVGQRFNADGDTIVHTACLAALITGRRQPENWTASSEVVDYFDLKGDLEALLAANVEVSFARKQYRALHPGQSAEIVVAGRSVGRIGAVHPQLQKSLDLPHALYYFEIELDALAAAQVPVFTPLSKFPEVRRDLAILIGRDIEAQALLNTVEAAAGEALVNLKLFDIYEGKGIDAERKSVGIGLTFRHSSRTLNEDEVNSAVNAVVAALQSSYGANLRN
ncbi:phenylalanine--tRNA ligase subunit beta [Spongiibacter nanhainus]|uniref:Phenylalanine--tRNA ligase beta subunit n=1 Tax=Spongiibacter nanhainus TaxID=2794344 RepID=A0A7T4UP98_9GAMM|nr:phenylalanine--tRNA ligase subunit beta [Spongiibacter nanhainus]QQD16823.1 phenylalanine--tRNA ligase subunit beta [Spongiibacter nanhainus]